MGSMYYYLLREEPRLFTWTCFLSVHLLHSLHALFYLSQAIIIQRDYEKKVKSLADKVNKLTDPVTDQRCFRL